jgi:exopolysaccharide biosynthesis polyprenyl glycosylphosphotransferase
MFLKFFKNLPRRKKKSLYGLALFLSDALFLALSFYMSYHLRFYITLFSFIESNPSYTINIHYVFYSIIFVFLTLVTMFFFRLYNWDYIYRGSGYYFRIFKAISTNIIIIIMAGYLLEAFSFSRIWIVLLYFLSLLFLFTVRIFISIVTDFIIKKLNLSSRTLIIGIGENAKRIKDSLSKSCVDSYEVVGCVEKEERIFKNKEYAKEFKILGYLKNLREIVTKNRIHSIIISGKEYKYYEILDILEDLKGLDVLVLMFPGFFEFSIKRMMMREVAGIPLIHISNVGFFGIDLFYKNIMDYFFGFLFFIISVPLFLFFGALIKIDSKGPVFYKQKRCTKGFKPFYMYKFRTMCNDADKRLGELRRYNGADGPIFKMKNDPRVTRVGKFLRKFSIDELPQLINVLRGEMSIVGPRPPLPQEVGEYQEWQKKRLNVKQGITGLWQVSGRSELSFEEMVRLDLYYIQNWSIGMDIKILLKTIPVVIFGRGAF